MISEMRFKGWEGVIQGKRRRESRAQNGVPCTHSVHIWRANTPPIQLPFSRQLFLHCNFLSVRENTDEKHTWETHFQSNSILKQALSYGLIPSSLNDGCYFTRRNDSITITVEYSKLMKQLTRYLDHSFLYLLAAPLKLARSQSQEKDY